MWILRRELGFRFKNIKKIQPPKIELLGLYLSYQVSYGRFTDFGTLQDGFYLGIFLGIFMLSFRWRKFRGTFYDGF